MFSHFKLSLYLKWTLMGEFLLHYSLFARKFYETPNQAKSPWNKKKQEAVGKKIYLCVFIFRVIMWSFVIRAAKLINCPLSPLKKFPLKKFLTLLLVLKQLLNFIACQHFFLYHRIFKNLLCWNLLC